MAAGASSSSKMSKELTIKAIEAKLKALESRADDFVINKTNDGEVPLIQKYQYNKNGGSERSSSTMQSNRKYQSRPRPFDRHQRRHKR